MKTEAQLMQAYNANDWQVMAAYENAVHLLQNKYGFEAVTHEFILNADANDVEFAQWVEAGLEMIVQDGHLA